MGKFEITKTNETHMYLAIKKFQALWKSIIRYSPLKIMSKTVFLNKPYESQLSVIHP